MKITSIKITSIKITSIKITPIMNLFLPVRSAALVFALPLMFALYLMFAPTMLSYSVFPVSPSAVSTATASSTAAVSSAVLSLLKSFVTTLPINRSGSRHSLLPKAVAIQKAKVIAPKGRQPKAILSPDGTLNLVFGWENTIYFKKTKLGPDQKPEPDRLGGPDSVHTDVIDPDAIDRDSADPVVVATLPEGLMLGMGRGPQLAIFEKKTVIAAVDKKGDLYSWYQNPNGNGWQGPIRINDVTGVAQEGFVALLAGNRGRFYAFWNDLRNGNNQIYGAISLDQGQSWQKSQQLYASSDTTICECCKVSAAADQNGNVHVMWRNQLSGYRDMYLLTLDQNLKSKTVAAKLGKGNWQLKGCPMDGGNLTVNPAGNVITVWRRENNLYTCRPGGIEKLLAQGRNPVVATTGKVTATAWNTGQQVFYQLIGGTEAVKSPIPKPGKETRPGKETGIINIGNGTYPTLAANGKQIVLCWESVDGQILSRILDVDKNQSR
jgi:hypothetical protein